VLTSVAKSPVAGGAGPLPVAILGEKSDHNAEAGFVGQLESRVPALSWPGASTNDQQKAERDRR
jgi:hypothetical protein